ncbi:hypothetical protein Drorol1_Dr00001048 [Drosera rotundifolia]
MKSFLGIVPFPGDTSPRSGLIPPPPTPSIGYGLGHATADDLPGVLFTDPSSLSPPLLPAAFDAGRLHKTTNDVSIVVMKGGFGTRRSTIVLSHESIRSKSLINQVDSMMAMATMVVVIIDRKIRGSVRNRRKTTREEERKIGRRVFRIV